MRKVFVDVILKVSRDGIKTPLKFTWEDGSEYEIDKVIEVCKASSLKVGGQGIRYTCRILNKQKYLFEEEDKWFMEGK